MSLKSTITKVGKGVRFAVRVWADKYSSRQSHLVRPGDSVPEGYEVRWATLAQVLEHVLPMEEVGNANKAKRLVEWLKASYEWKAI